MKLQIRAVIFYCGLLPLCFPAQAAKIQKEAAGISAETLVQALKLATGIHPIKVTSHQYDYDADFLYCHAWYATDDGLAGYDCKINSNIRIVDAPAKLLYDAMKSVNMLVDPGMSQNRITAEKVHCVMDIEASTAERFRCRWLES